MAFELELSGFDNVQAELRKAKQMITRKTKQFLRLEGEFVMADSKRNHVPLDKGELRRSGVVHKVETVDDV